MTPVQVQGVSASDAAIFLVDMRAALGGMACQRSQQAVVWCMQAKWLESLVQPHTAMQKKNGKPKAPEGLIGAIYGVLIFIKAPAGEAAGSWCAAQA